jgi:hypothetical protein
MMRSLVLVLVFMAAMTGIANAGTLEICGRKEKTDAGMTSCVEAQRKRTANLLRGLNATILETLGQQVQQTGDKSKLLDYQNAQAQHVRHLGTACGGLPSATERMACEADLTYAHMENLHRFLK